MSTVADTISAMQSQTAAYQQSSKDRTTGMTNDSNMFLKLQTTEDKIRMDIDAAAASKSRSYTADRQH